MLVLESADLRLRFTRHHGEMLLEFQPVGGVRKEWFSLGLLRGVSLGDRGASEVLDVGWARFLQESLNDLEARLGDPRAREELAAQLREQARLRGDALFPTAAGRSRDNPKR